MNSVPNRGGPHRALSSAVKSMYENMGPEQLRAMHEEARVGISSKDAYVKSKSKERLKYIDEERHRRPQELVDNVTARKIGKNPTQYGEPATKGGITKPGPNFKPSTWHG